ncbi:MAG: flagellar basal-body rod protein FlgB [Candidatus Atribacteria bacterium]|nr:flagellar basal-body rod protein FlgB [Candidatus Atribacteria bacterium]
MVGQIDPVLSLLERGLDLVQARQELLVQNVANVETPKYQRKDLDFEAALQESLRDKKEGVSLRVTQPAHLSSASESGLREKESNYWIRQDGSGVDIEQEMSLVLENTLYYQMLARMTSDKLSQLRTVAREVR